MTVINIDDLVEQAKALNAIADVIGQEPGYSIEGRGRYLHTREHDSLVVDVHNNCYFWNSNGEHGDVIEWLRARRGWDFKTSMEWLCKRAGIAEPEWGKVDPKKRAAVRERGDAFSVAVGVLSRWLHNDAEALGYAQGRGWTDQTIERAMLGYTGCHEKRNELREEMVGAMGFAGIDPKCPAAVAVVGYQGDVRQWSLDYDAPVNEKWLEKHWIPGVIGWDLLVYPHVSGGRVGYLSMRRVHPSEKYPKSHNLPVELVGDRQVYRNWEWSGQSTQCVIVEGQADAITLAQWGFPAIALCGVAADDRLVKLLGGRDEKKSIDFYIGLDADKAGEKNRQRVAEMFGPMTRLINWNGIGGITTFVDPDGAEKEVKDANDLLRGMLR